jgi:hypothetical protein
LPDWVEQRERELSGFDRAFGRGLLRQQIEANVQFLQPYVAAGHADLRRFNSPHVGRIVLTERCAFFAPYQATSHGRDNPVFKYRRGPVYDNLQRLFDQLWNAKYYALEFLNQLGGSWKMGGPYHQGASCEIVQDGDSLRLINEDKAESKARLDPDGTLIATGWNNIEGTVVGGGTRINWSNGTWWVR